jgi:hypothetical protein
MADQTSESVNVHECSWADLEATLIMPNGGVTVKITDVEGFKWARKNERGESRGTSGRPKKRTRGSPSYEGSATATRGGWMALLEAIEQAAIELGQVRGDEVIIGGIDFDVLLQHSPLGDPRIYTTKLKGCSLDGDSSDMKQGNEADLIELVLNPIKILTKSASGKWLVIA